MWEGNTQDYLKRLSWIYERSTDTEWVGEDIVNYVEKADGRSRYKTKAQLPWLLGLKSYELSAGKVKLHAMNLLDSYKDDKWYWRLNNHGLTMISELMTVPSHERIEKGANLLYKHLIKFSLFTRAFLWNLGKQDRFIKVQKFNNRLSWGDNCEKTSFVGGEEREFSAFESISSAIIEIPELIGQDIRIEVKTKLGVRIDYQPTIVRTSKMGKVNDGKIDSNDFPSLNRAWIHFVLNNDLMNLLQVEEDTKKYTVFSLNRSLAHSLIDEPHLNAELLDPMSFKDALKQTYLKLADQDGWVNISKLRNPVAKLTGTKILDGKEFDYKLQLLNLQGAFILEWKAGPAELGQGYFGDSSKTYLRII
jgi:hypothetical protein